MLDFSVGKKNETGDREGDDKAALEKRSTQSLVVVVEDLLPKVWR
jgi:hypothetical protein